VLGPVAGRPTRQVCRHGDVAHPVASADVRRTAQRRHVGDLAQSDGVAARRYDRDLADLSDALAFVRIQDDVDVPAAGAFGTELADRAAGEAGPQHAGDLPWR